MRLDEARSEAIDGAHVRATNMAEGTYVSYAFNGFRINFPNGSSSGWTPRDIDEAAEWEICFPEPAPLARDKWGRPQ